MKNLIVSIDDLASFDEVIDVRTPLEFAEDHVPGALNAPVLSNEERVIVGTLYKSSPFDATRVGAAMVARNIAQHLDTLFADRPRNWRPLIYCWRGGKRSGSMTTWFNLIGWQARQLDGGYKAYRHHVLQRLAALPARLSYVVLTGHTGTGKTRLLRALGEAGAQVLDLEGLARHRGSLLGALPDCSQPSQKAFDTELAAVLADFRADQPVFVEAESRRIGRITVPETLLDAFHAGHCVQVRAPLTARVAFLLDDYGHLFDTPDAFKGQLSRLVGLHSRQTVERWHALIDAGERAGLFRELVELHYDPAYARSSRRSFSALDDAMTFDFDPGSADRLSQARALLAQVAALPLSASERRTAPSAAAASSSTSTEPHHS